LSIDGLRLAPAIDYVVEAAEDASAAGVTIRVTGNLPPRAGTLTWAYAWTFTPYAFTVVGRVGDEAAVYGAVSISPAIVEPLIAASIAYVAVENVVVTELKRSRLALVFAFGLLHGLGFAGVLAELGLPPSEQMTALVAFNLGVEAGQLVVIAVAFLLVGWWSATKDWYRRRMVIPASLGIAGIALYWTFERLAPG
jgi:hypothetical protein